LKGNNILFVNVSFSGYKGGMKPWKLDQVVQTSSRIIVQADQREQALLEQVAYWERQLQHLSEQADHQEN
jgi:hypothetical protein